MRASFVFASAVSSAGLALAQEGYAQNQVRTNKDVPRVAANFPDVDVELWSPAFLDPGSVDGGFENGTAGPTSQQDLESFLQTLAARNAWMTYHTPDFKSEEGRAIPYVLLSTSTGPIPYKPPSTIGCNQTAKVRVWIQGGVHGNEPAGDQAVLAFLGKLDAQPEWALSLLEKLEIVVLPRYNPDGVAYFQRALATSFDPNRDHIKLVSQQSRDIKRINRQFNAHVSIDCHEYGAAGAVGPNGEYKALEDNQFSAFKNPNVHPDLRDMAETMFVPQVYEALTSDNFTVGPYRIYLSGPEHRAVDFVTDARGDVAVSLGQGLGFLSETRGIGLGDQDFRRRTAAGLAAIEAVVQISADNANVVYKAVEAARKDYINSDDEIIVTDYPRWTNKTLSLIRFDTGEVVNIPYQWGSNTPPMSNLTRARPEAYIFSRAWSHVAELLRVAGLQVDELPTDFHGEVEAYNITRADLATTKYQGTALTTIETQISIKNMSFPAGAYWVSSRQQDAAQAFLRLEPENPDSLATFNILPVNTGDEYQIYRIPRH